MNNIRTVKNYGGFTIIELMIVIAIIAVLAAIAFAVYREYVVRAEFGALVSEAADSKTCVAEVYNAEGSFDNAGSLCNPRASTNTSVGAGGVITATKGEFTVTFRPAPDANGVINWN